jgi:hypothetical protein
VKSEKEAFDVVILDQDTCRLYAELDESTALTLLATASEDPSCWNDIEACWMRYRTPVVPQDITDLSVQMTNLAAARKTIGQHGLWIVIDLVDKRILTGKEMEAFGRDAAFALDVTEEGIQRHPLFIHLPPWWEFHEQADESTLDQGRAVSWVVPKTNRQVLYGPCMIQDLATRIVDFVGSKRWISSRAAADAQSRYPFTVEVHRDWLMSTRDDLDGKTPRQMLHGGRSWIDLLASGQQFRFEDGLEVVALPTHFTGYEHAPLGIEELVMYFDLCRELIESGWQWCIDQKVSALQAADKSRLQRQLELHLAKKMEEWLESSFEGGSPPRFIIECSRRRVPRGVGVPIVGMTERETEDHGVDCDCPICDTMADGRFGTSFSGIDGYHLELDEEFAFSTYETREEWEMEYQDFTDGSDQDEDEVTEESEENAVERSPFASAWSGAVSDGPIPGDPDGHLKLAFLLAEVVGVLQSTGGSRDDVERLNSHFRKYRQAAPGELPGSAHSLANCLNDLGEHYPVLVSRVADLQSRIDEHLRRFR